MSIIKTTSTLALIALFGAGCAATTPSPTPEQTGQVQRSATDQKTTPSTTASEATATEPSMDNTTHASDTAMAAPGVDDTWQTYTSRSGDFSFKWPTKGSYAPTWEVTLLNASDPELKDGCDTGKDIPLKNAEQITTDAGVTFCHTSQNEGAAGSAYYTDAFTTKVGDSYAVITLTKHVSSAGALGLLIHA